MIAKILRLIGLSRPPRVLPVSNRNQAQWVAIGAFLADRVVNP